MNAQDNLLGNTEYKRRLIQNLYPNDSNNIPTKGITYIKLFLVKTVVGITREGTCKEGRQVYGKEHSCSRIRMKPQKLLLKLLYVQYSLNNNLQ